MAARAALAHPARVSALRVFLPLVLFAAGCARQSHLPPPISPEERQAYAPQPLEPGQEVLPSPGVAPALEAAPALAKTESTAATPIGPLPGGEACLQALAQRGVRFSRREAERGVPTPILVQSDIGNVHFFSDGRLFVADCRLALALAELAPELSALGVTQMRFSGAYVYRNKRSGRLSLHAHGLAIDVHEIWFGAEQLSVKKDFARGLGRECTPNMPKLNELACRVRAHRLFKELLTPDDNADHYDHLHFGLAPLPGEVPPEPPPVVLREPTRRAPAPTAAATEEVAPLEDGVPALKQEQKTKPAPAPHHDEVPGSLPEEIPPLE